jgi:D-alanyl-D-alanine carboxypeptidase
MYTLGRLNDDTTTGQNDIWYTRDGSTWQKTNEDPPWLGREDHGALVYKDRLWVLSGMDVNWHWNNDVWRSSDLSASGAPTQAQAPAPPALALSAKAAVLMTLGQSGDSVALYAGNADAALPIASMTKLMTALVASEAFGMDDTVAMSEASVSGKGLSGLYKAGDTFSVRAALTAMLVASHNEMANALADKLGRDAFVARMNARAKELGLSHTHFVNPSGLDEDAGDSNASSAGDIAKLLGYIYKNRQDIFAILGSAHYALYDAAGGYRADLATTDKLLASGEVLGGKTGETPKALQNLSFIARVGSALIVGVVVGSGDSAADARSLLEYARNGAL